MSTKSCLGVFFLAILFCHEFIHVDGVPLLKSARNSNKLRIPKPTTKTPSGRNPRFFGKFSVVAGLGLPDPHAPPPINRADSVYDHVPAQLTASYNFPPSRWGPYVAAVYEPPPLSSFFRDPLSYLAAIFNPKNWFTAGSPGAGNQESTSAQPTTLLDKVQEGDFLLMLGERENEIPNDDRQLIEDKIEMKMEMDGDEKQTSLVQTTEETKKVQNFGGIINGANKNMELLAEAATINFVENDKIDQNLEDDGRQTRRNVTSSTTKATTHRTTSRATSPRTTTINMTRPPTTSSEETVSSEVTTEMLTTMSISNETMNMTTMNNSTRPNNATQYPDKNITYPQYHNGYYYYGGYSQNVSNVEFTTQATATTNPLPPPNPQQINTINRFLQQYPNVYYDSYEPQPQAAFDYYNRFVPPENIDYYNRQNEHLSNNQNHIFANGFKPSFPYQL